MLRLHNRRAILAIALVALLATTAMLAYAIVTVEGVRNRISQRIRSKFKVENLVIKVVPFESGSWTQQGRFETIVVSADKIERKTIAIRKIYIKAFDVVLDIEELYKDGDIRTKSRKRTVFSGRVYKDDLNKMLALKQSSIENLRVDFEGNKLVFTGRYRLAFGHNLRMVGELKVKDHRKIDFVPTAVSINGLPLPAGPLRTVVNKLNPLIDFAKIPLQPKVDEIKMEKDYILIRSK